MRLRLLLGLLAVATLFVSTAGAAINQDGCTDANTYTVANGEVSLATLVGDHSCILSGDKLFFNFSASSATPAGFTVEAIGNGVDTGNVETAHDIGLWGIEFGKNLNTEGDLEFRLFYSVSVLDGAGLLIHDIQNITNFSGPPGTGSSIIETATHTGTGDGAGEFARSTLDLNDIQDPPGELIQSDKLIFNTPVGYPDYVRVEKDVALVGANGAPARLSFIQQRFSQVPEPKDVALMLGAGLALLIWRKRARATAV